MNRRTPTTTRVIGGIAVSLGVALTVAFALSPGRASGLERALELLGVIVLGLVALSTAAAPVTAWLGGWQEDEAEFELTVRRAERLAAVGTAAEPEESDFLELDPLLDEDFEELVRDALDELPDLLQNALAHVAVVISDGGRRAGAYGLYQGDGVHRDDHPDRIVIFRDTLRRDFGADPDLLRDQVVRSFATSSPTMSGSTRWGSGSSGFDAGPAAALSPAASARGGRAPIRARRWRPARGRRGRRRWGEAQPAGHQHPQHVAVREREHVARAGSVASSASTRAPTPSHLAARAAVTPEVPAGSPFEDLGRREPLRSLRSPTPSARHAGPGRGSPRGARSRGPAQRAAPDHGELPSREARRERDGLLAARLVERDVGASRVRPVAVQSVSA